MIEARIVLLLWALPVLGQLDRIPPPSSANPLTRNAAAIEAGQRRFRQLCSSCHGRSVNGLAIVYSPMPCAWSGWFGLWWSRLYSLAALLTATAITKPPA